MDNFKQQTPKTNYLLADIFEVDDVILQFSSWSKELHDFKIERYYVQVYQVGEDIWEHEKISKEEYFANIEDGSYITDLNYNDFITTPDFNHFFNEFHSLISDDVIHNIENDYVDFIKNSIDNAITEGQAKSILKTTLTNLKVHRFDLQKIKTNRNKPNIIQSFVIDTYSESYNFSLTTLIEYYKNIYEKIVSEFIKEPEQLSINSEPKIELHSQIFKDNAFLVWQKMFQDFKISETSRTDVKFCFEIMKYDGLIHSTVKQVSFLDWINKTYHLAISKPQYLDFKNDVKRNAIYNSAKSTYIKQ